MIRWIFRALAAVFGLLIVVVALVLGIGAYRLERRIDRPGPAIAAGADSFAIARGRHIAEFSCANCHATRGDELPLSGSRFSFIADSTGKGMGDLYAPNLTPGGEVLKSPDALLARAIREGVGRGGKSLLIMPSFSGMSDQDVGAVIAFLRSQPAIEHATPPRKLGFLPYFIVGTGAFSASAQPRPVGSVAAVTPAPESDYGGYVIGLTACRECHGKDLRGIKPGPLPGPPPGPDIVAVAKAHGFADFDRALRNGVSTTGRPLAPAMPWETFSRFTDLEARAIYEFLRSR